MPGYMKRNIASHPLSAVLFDLDDTLIDSLEARVAALSSAFQGAGLQHLDPKQFFQEIRGRQLLDALTELEEREGRELGLVERYRQAYWIRRPGLISMYPGIRPLLETLRKRGVKLGVVTQKWRSVELDGRRVGAAEELLELGIADMFSAVVGLEDVTRFKPDPEPVEVALRLLSVAPQEAVMVGDSPADIEAGRAAGCLTCHATWGLPIAGRSADLGADMVAETPEAILRLPFA